MEFSLVAEFSQWCIVFLEFSENDFTCVPLYSGIAPLAPTAFVQVSCLFVCSCVFYTFVSRCFMKSQLLLTPASRSHEAKLMALFSSCMNAENTLVG